MPWKKFYAQPVPFKRALQRDPWDIPLKKIPKYEFWSVGKPNFPLIAVRDDGIDPARDGCHAKTPVQVSYACLMGHEKA